VSSLFIETSILTLNDFKGEELEVAKLAKFECGMLRLKISN
jgi:hypothetical protein